MSFRISVSFFGTSIPPRMRLISSCIIAYSSIIVKDEMFVQLGLPPAPYEHLYGFHPGDRRSLSREFPRIRRGGVYGCRPCGHPAGMKCQNSSSIKDFRGWMWLRIAKKSRSIGLFYLIKLRGPEAKTRILEAFSSEFLKYRNHHRNQYTKPQKEGGLCRSASRFTDLT